MILVDLQGLHWENEMCRPALNSCQLNQKAYHTRERESTERLEEQEERGLRERRVVEYGLVAAFVTSIIMVTKEKIIVVKDKRSP